MSGKIICFVTTSNTLIFTAIMPSYYSIVFWLLFYLRKIIQDVDCIIQIIIAYLNLLNSSCCLKKKILLKIYENLRSLHRECRSFWSSGIPPSGKMMFTILCCIPSNSQKIIYVCVKWYFIVLTKNLFVIEDCLSLKSKLKLFSSLNSFFTSNLKLFFWKLV